MFKTADEVIRFLFAGNATITLRSTRTGDHFTYKVQPSDDGKVFFVKVLTGPDNRTDFQFLGVYRNGRYSHGMRSRVGPSAGSARAFEYLAACLVRGGDLPALLEARHENRCGACGRKLTVPESIDSGLGPECAGRVQRVRRCEEVF